MKTEDDRSSSSSTPRWSRSHWAPTRCARPAAPCRRSERGPHRRARSAAAAVPRPAAPVYAGPGPGRAAHRPAAPGLKADGRPRGPSTQGRAPVRRGVKTLLQAADSGPRTICKNFRRPVHVQPPFPAGQLRCCRPAPADALACAGPEPQGQHHAGDDAGAPGAGPHGRRRIFHRRDRSAGRRCSHRGRWCRAWSSAPCAARRRRPAPGQRAAPAVRAGSVVWSLGRSFHKLAHQVDALAGWSRQHRLDAVDAAVE